MKDTRIPNTIKSRVKKHNFFNIGIAVLQSRVLGIASVYSPHTGPYPYSILHFLCHRHHHPYKAKLVVLAFHTVDGLPCRNSVKALESEVLTPEAVMG